MVLCWKDGTHIDPRPVVSGEKGSRMTRKASLAFLSAIAGAGLTLLATQPQTSLVSSRRCGSRKSADAVASVVGGPQRSEVAPAR